LSVSIKQFIFKARPNSFIKHWCEKRFDPT
jgi:hypothetical protein